MDAAQGRSNNLAGPIDSDDEDYDENDLVV